MWVSRLRWVRRRQFICVDELFSVSRGREECSKLHYKSSPQCALHQFSAVLVPWLNLLMERASLVCQTTEIDVCQLALPCHRPAAGEGDSDRLLSMLNAIPRDDGPRSGQFWSGFCILFLQKVTGPRSELERLS